jgi:DNA-directed RNA polymerase subunit RPC12/RpoP
MSDDQKKTNVAHTNVEGEAKAAGKIAFEIADQLIFGGLFEKHAARDVAPPAPVPLPAPSGAYVVDESMVAGSSAIAGTGMDARVIDAPVCMTCAGKGRLGNVGHEIVCPKCHGTGEGRSACMTCGGTKKLGRPGHEIRCPNCSP